MWELVYLLIDWLIFSGNNEALVKGWHLGVVPLDSFTEPLAFGERPWQSKQKDSERRRRKATNSPMRCNEFAHDGSM